MSKINKEYYETRTKNEKFILLMCDAQKPLFPELKNSYLAFLLYLSTYINYDGFLSNRKKIPLTKKNIAELLGISYAEFLKFLKVAFDNGFAYEKDEKIYLNSIYFCKGKMPLRSGCIFKLFISNMRDAYMNPDNNHKIIGGILRLIPYMDIKSEALVKVKNGDTYDHHKYLTLSDMVNIAGYSMNKRNLTVLLNTKLNKTSDTILHIHKYKENTIKKYIKINKKLCCMILYEEDTKFL